MTERRCDCTRADSPEGEIWLSLAEAESVAWELSQRVLHAEEQAARYRVLLQRITDEGDATVNACEEIDRLLACYPPTRPGG